MKKVWFACGLIAAAALVGLVANAEIGRNVPKPETHVHVHGSTPQEMESSISPGVVRLSRDRQQMIGLRIGQAVRSTSKRTVRALGHVEIDEDRMFPVAAAGEGWVTKIEQGTTTGSIVRSGQPLVTVYGREYVAAQRTFLYNLRTSEDPPPIVPGESEDRLVLPLQEAMLALRGMGFGDAQIQQLTKSRRVSLDAVVTAPAAGVIIARNVFPKQRFDHGAELFRIADLSRVWITADLSGSDADSIPSGITADVTVPGRPGATLHATVSGAVSRFDRGSRTLKLRLNAVNNALVLRPDMFVDLAFPITLPEATTVPVEAIVDSGLSRIVFVNRGDGLFEARPVETGRRSDHDIEILRGLEPGDSIVLSGQFLLDSENRMRHGDAGGHD